MKNLVRASLIAMLIASLTTSCGWHLRGSTDVASTIDSVHVSARNIHGDLVRELTRTLINNDVMVPKSATEAQFSIVLLKQSSKQRTATVSASARVSEYRLTEEVSFLILAADGTTLLPDTTVSAERVYEFDENSVLAKEDEKRQLQREMRGDLIRQIMNRLNAISRRAAAAPPESTDATEN